MADEWRHVQYLLLILWMNFQRNLPNGSSYKPFFIIVHTVYTYHQWISVKGFIISFFCKYVTTVPFTCVSMWPLYTYSGPKL